MVKRCEPWDIESVASRFHDAAVTSHRLPNVRPQGYVNEWAWLSMQMKERYPDTDPVCRRPEPSPKEVDQMLEVMGWVKWLEVDQRLLVWMRANRYRWGDIGRRFGCDRNTAARRWAKAMSLMVLRLNNPGIELLKDLRQVG